VATLLIVAIIAASSLIAVAFGRYACGAWPGDLPGAARRMLEFLGLWFLCLALDVALGIAAVLTVRTVTTRFVSVYLVNDISLLIFSAIQGAILHLWLSTSKE
jgi:hypothetical protein